jgi:hypothetical protein
LFFGFSFWFGLAFAFFLVEVVLVKAIFRIWLKWAQGLRILGMLKRLVVARLITSLGLCQFSHVKHHDSDITVATTKLRFWMLLWWHRAIGF